MSISVQTGIEAAHQESSFANATLQNVSDTHSISIAVHLPEGAMQRAGVDPDDAEQVEAWMERVFASAVAEGCEVEVQIGPDEMDPDQDDQDETEAEAHAS
jgi:hypothetical protein